MRSVPVSRPPGAAEISSLSSAGWSRRTAASVIATADLGTGGIGRVCDDVLGLHADRRRVLEHLVDLAGDVPGVPLTVGDGRTQLVDGRRAVCLQRVAGDGVEQCL